ncbi:MAG: copper homeostasis protein CutC, partial [Chitinophagaceae bacterium]
MQADIRHCIEAGCDGIVTGILTSDGHVDKERCTMLVRLAKQFGLGVTFHRAFDVCADQYQALEDIIEIGFERILTSGGKTTAMEGATVIAHLVEKAAGRISIMPGCGITDHNVADLIHFTGVTEIHSSAKVHVDSKMKYHNDHIIMGSYYGDEYNFNITNKEKVSEILRLANS